MRGNLWESLLHASAIPHRNNHIRPNLFAPAKVVRHGVSTKAQMEKER